MLRGIKLSVAVFALLSLKNLIACELNSGKKIISLSAPITWVLWELELLEDPKLDSVSTFHYTGKSSPKKIAGGLFLSSKILSSKEAVVFFDQSKELSEAIKKSAKMTGIEVSTRGDGPFVVHRKAMSSLAPFLKGCGAKVKDLKKDLLKARVELEKFHFTKRPVVFFLGRFEKNSRPPRLVIGRDGFVDYFSKHNGLKTYPSELHYISWSPKILSDLSALKIGTSQGEELELKVEKIEDEVLNISHAGALSPGLGQVRFMQALIGDERLSQLGGTK